MTLLPVYQDLLKSSEGREKVQYFIDLECCYVFQVVLLVCRLLTDGWFVVGNDIKNVVNDGYPAENPLATDLRKDNQLCNEENNHSSSCIKLQGPNQPHLDSWL